MLVSVCMITYNHEKYIREAIEGILMQKTDFEYEFIIANDCSQDSTDIIVNDCIHGQENGRKIKYFKHDKNIGMQPNFIFSLQQCKGKYIALCEGDDYWTDPYKLQKQVNYISKNEGCNLVFTDISSLNEHENKFYPNWANIKRQKYEFKDLVDGNVISTCTVLLRKPEDEVIQDWLHHFKIGDYPLYLLLLRTGYAYFLNENTAVYRQHSGGVFSLKGAENLIDTNIELLKNLEKLILSNEELSAVRKSLIKWYYAKIVRLCNDIQFNEIRHFIKKELKLSDVFYNYSYFFKILILYFFPKMKSSAFEKIQGK